MPISKNGFKHAIKQVQEPMGLEDYNKVTHIKILTFTTYIFPF